MFKNQQALETWLNQNGIKTDTWGHGDSKPVMALWQEVEAGETTLESPPPHRVIHVVQVHIKRGEFILIEAKQEMTDGRFRSRNVLPAEKMKPGESPLDAALRCLEEELTVTAAQITLVPTYQERHQEQVSPSYPGLITRYHFYEVEATIPDLPNSDFWRDNTSQHQGDPIKRHLWAWQPLTDL